MDLCNDGNEEFSFTRFALLRNEPERQVRINEEEMPMMYNPKSYSMPDLTDRTEFSTSIHMHPNLKNKVSWDSDIDLSMYFPKRKTVNCSPFPVRKNSPFLKRKASKKYARKDDINRTQKSIETRNKENIFMQLVKRVHSLPNLNGVSNSKTKTSSDEDEVQITHERKKKIDRKAKRGVQIKVLRRDHLPLLKKYSSP